MFLRFLSLFLFECAINGDGGEKGRDRDTKMMMTIRENIIICACCFFMAIIIVMVVIDRFGKKLDALLIPFSSDR